MSKRWTMMAAALAALVSCGTAAAAEFVDIDPPGSQGTHVSGIDASGDIAGTFRDSVGGTSAFLRLKNGTYVVIGSLDVLPATAAIGGNKQVTGATNDGHAYIADRHDRIETFDVSGAVTTQPLAFNNKGVIAGYFVLPGAEVLHGFLRGKDGSVQTFDAPHAGDATLTGTLVKSVNGRGQATGFARDDDVRSWGFLRRSDGHIAPIAPPDVDENGRGTEPMRINKLGEVAGNYIDKHGQQGFLRDAEGNYVEFRVAQGASVTALNDNGDIAGFVSPGTRQRGFLRTRAGEVTIFDAPKAGRRFNGTAPTDIDNDGVIVGSYEDAKGRSHGFMRLP